MKESEEPMRTSGKRKAPRAVEEMDREVEEAKLTLLEILARKRLFAAMGKGDLLLT